jgi:hypothetical protein
MNDLVNVYMTCAEWNGIHNKLWQREMHPRINNIASARGAKDSPMLASRNVSIRTSPNNS